MNRNYISLIIPFLLISCREKPEQRAQSEPPLVTTVVVRTEYTSIPVSAAGRITTKDEVKLSFKKGGVIELVNAEEGQWVKAGQLLARLKQSEFLSAKTQAELAAGKAERDFFRVENLYRDSVATLEQYQNAQTALEMARQILAAADFNFEHSEIRAPANGKILRKLASPGELIGEGMPVFLFGSTDSPWVLHASLADRDVVSIVRGDSAFISLDPWPQKQFRATVTGISGMADPYTGTFNVELTLEGETTDVAAGMIGKADIYPSDKSWYSLIPANALVSGNGGTARVYVLKGGVATLTAVNVEAIRGDHLYASGRAGEIMEVVTSGHQFIDNGTAVQVIRGDSIN